MHKEKEITVVIGYKINENGDVFSRRGREVIFGNGHQIIGTRGVLLDDWKKIKNCVNQKGYLVVTLIKDGRKVTKSVHRLVAEAFLDKVADKPLVCHKDGDPHNNHVSNLYWGSVTDNNRDTVKHGKAGRAKGERHGNHKLTEKDVLEIRSLCGLAGYGQRRIAKLYGIAQQSVSDIKNLKLWGHLN